MTVNLERETKETAIRLTLDVRGSGKADVQLSGALAGSEPGGSTPISPEVASGPVTFYRHMLITLAKWSGMDLTIEARSVDGIEHHLVEDVAITLGRALRQAVDVGAIERTAFRVMPMDEALVLVAVDLVERPHYEGPLPDPLMDHVFRSFAMESGITLHVQTLRGTDPHHVVEAAFKGLALALKDALAPRGERLSTKGEVRLAGGGGAE